MIFDVSDYTLPTFDSIDWQKTKEQVGIFFTRIQNESGTNGLTCLPKVNQ